MSEPVVYWIDANDQVVRVNDEWDVFARENDAPDLAAGRVVGQTLWSGIADAATRHLYAGLLSRVRAGLTARFPLRCDSPTLRRRLQLIVSPEAAGLVRFESVLLAVEPRAEQPLLRRDVPRRLDLVTVCGWCKRVNVLDGWLEIEEAVAQLRLFDDDYLPELSHGICADCGGSVLATMDQARPPDDDGRCEG